MYEISENESEKVIELYMKAFSDYPKLMGIFPKNETRKSALEATLRFYCAYDLHFGKGLALDENINEAVLFVHSDEMHYTQERHAAAGSFSKEYVSAVDRLSVKDRSLRLDLFDELDKMEEALDIPEPHLYVDFLGVLPEKQKQGRGHELMKAVIDIADRQHLPVMLFTNTPEDVAFYESLGFRCIGHTVSEKFKFDNTYLIRNRNGI